MFYIFETSLSMTLSLNWNTIDNKILIVCSNLRNSPGAQNIYAKEISFVKELFNEKHRPVKIAVIITAKKLISFGESIDIKSDIHNIKKVLKICFHKKYKQKSKIALFDIESTSFKPLSTMHHYDSNDRLDKIQDYDIIHIIGGNTFYLLEAFKNNQGNVLEIIKWIKSSKPGIIFGQSAGAICISDSSSWAAFAKAISPQKILKWHDLHETQNKFMQNDRIKYSISDAFAWQKRENNNENKLKSIMKMNIKKNIEDKKYYTKKQYDSIVFIIQKYLYALEKKSVRLLTRKSNLKIFDVTYHTMKHIYSMIRLKKNVIFRIKKYKKNTKDVKYTYFLNMYGIKLLSGDLIKYILYKLENTTIHSTNEIEIPTEEFFFNGFPNGLLVPHYDSEYEIAIKNNTKFLQSMQSNNATSMEHRKILYLVPDINGFMISKPLKYTRLNSMISTHHETGRLVWGNYYEQYNI